MEVTREIVERTVGNSQNVAYLKSLGKEKLISCYKEILDDLELGKYNFVNPTGKYSLPEVNIHETFIAGLLKSTISTALKAILPERFYDWEIKEDLEEQFPNLTFKITKYMSNIKVYIIKGDRMLDTLNVCQYIHNTYKVGTGTSPDSVEFTNRLLNEIPKWDDWYDQRQINIKNLTNKEKVEYLNGVKDVLLERIKTQPNRIPWHEGEDLECCIDDVHIPNIGSIDEDELEDIIPEFDKVCRKHKGNLKKRNYWECNKEGNQHRMDVINELISIYQNKDK